jgi:hypothetical protein
MKIKRFLALAAAFVAFAVVNAGVSHLVERARAAFTLSVPQGPSLGDYNVNPYTLAQAINQFNQQQVTTGLTALAGGGQTGATALGYGLNQVGTVASGSDSVQLPACSVGAVVYVTNDGANSMQVFGAVGRTDTINGTAGATGVAQANGAHAIYVCAVPAAASGKWTTIRATS